MKVKNLIGKLQEFNPEANIYFTLDLNSEEGYPKVEIIEIANLQLVGLIKKARIPEARTN
ncbi:MAG: hypothetical protein ACXACX_02530 [Candidatus Hodarchaeales archaeon]|jgi:hypothetical protein